MVSDFATIEEVVGIVPRKVNEPPTRLLKKTMSGGVLVGTPMEIT